MKHLRLFESFSEEHMYKILKRYNIGNYTINEDGSIDVDGYVSLVLRWLKIDKIPLKFRNVTGVFDCSYNRLYSLEGCPEKVDGSFTCANNKLTSLEGCPKFVGGNFHCSNNYIITFEHLPFSIGGDFYCIDNPIYELWILFEDYSKIELFNYYDIIQDDVIILDRLNIFLEEIGKRPVKRVKGYKCI